MVRYIPFGYEIFDGEIKIIEREAEVVRNVYSLYVQGLSLKDISERLNQIPITYAGDGRAWDKNIVKRMLENPKYMVFSLGGILLESISVISAIIGIVRHRKKLIVNSIEGR